MVGLRPFDARSPLGSVDDCTEERYSWVGMQYHQLRDHLEASDMEYDL